jgi:predicted SAM-dependent methyltransferase
MSGWIATDVNQLNILVERDWDRYFRVNSIEAILAEHVWEHLTQDEAATAAGLCLRYLKASGWLRIAVPDGFHPDPAYLAAVRPGGSGPGAKDHKVLYNIRSLTELLEAAGFQTRALEYFDERGQFHAHDWNPENGMVRRSARFDQRNQGGELRYTSIIVDAVKPGKARQNGVPTST